MRKTIILLSFFSLFFVSRSSAFASVSSSTNYNIQYDSVNNSGGISNSANYGFSDTTGDVGSGSSYSPSYKNNAGFQKFDEGEISISAPGVIGLGAIDGFLGGSADASGNVLITTNHYLGYTLKIRTDNSPAFRSSSGLGFPNYNDGGETPDFSWSIEGDSSAFGFTPEGSSIVQKYRDNGSSCNTGVGDTVDACWYYIAVSDQDVAYRSGPTGTGGEVTGLKFKYEAGSQRMQQSGSYFANITVTAITN